VVLLGFAAVIALTDRAEVVENLSATVAGAALLGLRAVAARASLQPTE
jgi:hypothetical protein